MKEIEVKRAAINMELLHEELQEALGAAYVGVGVVRESVVVHMQDDALLDEEEQARQVVREHEPEKLTQRQTRELNTHQAREVAARAFIEQPNNLDKALDWLVLEVAHLAGRSDITAAVLALKQSGAAGLTPQADKNQREGG